MKVCGVRCFDNEESQVMTEQTRAPKTSKLLTPSDFYGPTALLLGENAEGYQALVQEIMLGLHPFDIFENIWMGELIDLSWDIFRLRELKSQLLNIAIAQAIRSANPIVDQEVKKYESTRDALASTKEGCQTDSSDPELDKLLHSVASTPDMRLVAAQALEQKLDCIDRIDGMITVYQERRNAILREINHHRLNFVPILQELKAAQLEMIKGDYYSNREARKMASERKIKANRANALASTGPKTTQGKARAALNARRHGLAICDNSFFADDINRLTQKIAGKNAAIELTETARRIAEAQIELKRIRRVRMDIFARNMNGLDNRNYNAGFNKTSVILTNLVQQLVKVDRYEQRALSRRKFAIRAFDLARRLASQIAVPPPAATDKK